MFGPQCRPMKSAVRAHPHNSSKILSLSQHFLFLLWLFTLAVAWGLPIRVVIVCRHSFDADDRLTCLNALLILLMKHFRKLTRQILR
jgi:hypothetical protein